MEEEVEEEVVEEEVVVEEEEEEVVVVVVVPQSLQTLRQMGIVKSEYWHSRYFEHQSEAQAQKSVVSLGAGQQHSNCCNSQTNAPYADQGAGEQKVPAPQRIQTC